MRSGVDQSSDCWWGWRAAGEEDAIVSLKGLRKELGGVVMTPVSVRILRGDGERDCVLWRKGVRHLDAEYM